MPLLRDFISWLSTKPLVTRPIARTGMRLGFARRFIAGETLEEALQTAAGPNAPRQCRPRRAGVSPSNRGRHSPAPPPPPEDPAGQGGVSGTGGGRVPREAASRRELYQAHADPLHRGIRPRDRHARRRDARPRQAPRARERAEARRLGGADAPRRAARPARVARAGGVPGPRLRHLRHAVGALLHAPPRRAAGQRRLRAQEPRPREVARARRSAVSSEEGPQIECGRLTKTVVRPRRPAVARS